MSIIDNAIEHFSTQAVRELEVPEWGVTVYAKKLTLADKAKLIARSKKNQGDYICYQVIFGALDKKGNQLFGLEDLSKLKDKVDPEVVSRVSNFIAGVAISEDEAEGNS